MRDLPQRVKNQRYDVTRKLFWNDSVFKTLILQVFSWFPMQSKFNYIPPNLVSEGVEFQLDRLVKLAKAARSDLSHVTGGHLNIEEQIIR